MKGQPLWRLSLVTTPEAEDALTDLLGAVCRRPATSYCNLRTHSCVVSVFGPGAAIRSPNVRKAIRAGLRRAKQYGLTVGSGRIRTEKVRRVDWAESWKRHFPPLAIGNTLMVTPSWIKRPPRKYQAHIILDPGLSFGTGQHPTTSFCLRAIVRLKNPEARMSGNLSPRSFLDLGSGSGILAIAAAKLGYRPVRAIDFDPEAVRVAQANARKNRVAERIRITRGDLINLPLRPRRKYDLICANLNSNLLIAESRRISGQLKDRGTLVLAGILKSEFGRVQRTFKALGLYRTAARTQRQWRSGWFVPAR